VGQYDPASAASTTNVTVTSGFGQPDLIFFLNGSRDSGTDVAGDLGLMFGVAQSDTVRQCSYMQSRNGVASAATTLWQKQRAVLMTTSAGAADREGDLSAKGSWPTDGFQLSWPDTPGSSSCHSHYLALKGTFQATLGVNTALTAGSTQDNACGFAPKGALLWGGNLAASASIDTTSAALGAMFFGASDMTNEACSVWTDDDGAAIMDMNSRSSESKGIQFYNQALALQSEADVSANGNNLRLTWNDLDTVAREYNWVALGDAPVAYVETPLVMARR
jgi:hypothetical protein